MSSTPAKRILGRTAPITDRVGLSFDSTIILSVMTWGIFEIPWILGSYATLEQAAAMLVAKAALCGIGILCLRDSRVARYLFLFICFVGAGSIILQFPAVYQDSSVFAALYSIEALLKLTACVIVLSKHKRILAYR